MSKSLAERFWEIAGRLLDDEDEESLSDLEEETKEELAAKVKSAKNEWLGAISYFNQAVEPELVDHAIISLQAAERKYMYWLKRLKSHAQSEQSAQS
ncbi:MAG TPA: DUF2508 family protein [Firmicutes bacterium]|nr:DUF2508 family protein [Bacillota bacterium]